VHKSYKLATGVPGVRQGYACRLSSYGVDDWVSCAAGRLPSLIFGVGFPFVICF
jgi:hypothetical protein